MSIPCTISNAAPCPAPEDPFTILTWHATTGILRVGEYRHHFAGTVKILAIRRNGTIDIACLIDGEWVNQAGTFWASDFANLPLATLADMAPAPRPTDLPAVARAFAVLTEPRVARELRRRAIDAILAEDARQHPAFATARRAGVLAMMERSYSPDLARAVLLDLHEYEAERGGQRTPNRAAWVNWRGVACVAAYERARSLP